MTKKNDYQASLMRNPGFNETEKVNTDLQKLSILR